MARGKESVSQSNCVLRLHILCQWCMSCMSYYIYWTLRLCSNSSFIKYSQHSLWLPSSFSPKTLDYTHFSLAYCVPISPNDQTLHECSWLMLSSVDHSAITVVYTLFSFTPSLHWQLHIHSASTLHFYELKYLNSPSCIPTLVCMGSSLLKLLMWGYPVPFDLHVHYLYTRGNFRYVIPTEC